MVTFVPSMLRWSVADMKPGARSTEPSVARVRRSTSRCWLAGSTVETFISVMMPSFSTSEAAIAYLDGGRADPRRHRYESRARAQRLGHFEQAEEARTHQRLFGCRQARGGCRAGNAVLESYRVVLGE